MSEFGSMHVADSLKASWVDSDGKSLMTGKSLRGATTSPVEIIIPEKIMDSRITNLEKELSILRNSVIALSEKILSLEPSFQDAPQPEKKPKKAKK
jgi:hypothetical protein